MPCEYERVRAFVEHIETSPGSLIFARGKTLKPSDVRAVMVAAEERDEFRDLLRDLVMLDGEESAIGGGPGFRERRDKAWAAAREKFEP